MVGDRMSSLAGEGMSLGGEEMSLTGGGGGTLLMLGTPRVGGGGALEGNRVGEFLLPAGEWSLLLVVITSFSGSGGTSLGFGTMSSYSTMAFFFIPGGLLPNVSFPGF